MKTLLNTLQKASIAKAAVAGVIITAAFAVAANAAVATTPQLTGEITMVGGLRG